MNASRKTGRDIGGQPLGHLSLRKLVTVCAGTLITLASGISAAYALPPKEIAEGRGPVYQMHAYGGSPRGRGGGHAEYNHGHFPVVNSPQIHAGSFQRPYPYHLDYYRMRYGGSYAPYFGNLYGPPQIVAASPYYAPYLGGGYGGYGVGYPLGVGSGPPAGYCPCDSALPAEGQEQ